ncbi:MAG: hypothetical protein AVDCRST_MAG28-2741 [uncultured Rubrobacteraceae bacterium]|uniref:Uncharacterized protein n=1 Tax=uncultured Rubrobacteraceae bacterium TaxID=349277 RepID=A0A6J4QX65_9ACTN|nr:MAG: hypothetical protein AVDCRST_MAG28-2741 [uncultured Rubrobacteraceae bacterium]
MLLFSAIRIFSLALLNFAATIPPTHYRIQDKKPGRFRAPAQ